jgi:hypothetical protein
MDTRYHSVPGIAAVEHRTRACGILERADVCVLTRGRGADTSENLKHKDRFEMADNHNIFVAYLNNRCHEGVN